MSGGKKQSSSTPVPEAPKPQNEYFYDNGFLRSDRVYDKGRGGYISNVYSTPEEQAIDKQATGFISQLVGQVPNAFNMTPEQQNAQIEAYAAPQRRALENSYNQALGTANMAANSSGMRNSVGFENYRADKLDKNRAEGLADIAANSELMRYQLPSMALKPYADAFNLYNAALSGEQAREMSSFEPAYQGSNAGNSFASSNYNNLVNYYQLKNSPQQKSGGFMSKLFGGF